MQNQLQSYYVTAIREKSDGLTVILAFLFMGIVLVLAMAWIKTNSGLKNSKEF